MKKLVMIAAAAVSLGAFASAKNLIYDFQPSVDDCYADGTPVLDYESYALVWLAKGSDGVEITADCKVVDESKGKILRVRKSFKRGELFAFQVDASISEPCVKAGGNWAVYLLDTRVYGPDGRVSLAETANGVTAAINAAAKIDRSVVPVSKGTSGPEETRLGAAGRTMLATAVPADTPNPEITGISVVDGKVRVRVRKTVPYLQYNLAAGDDVGAIGGKKAIAPQNGVADGEIELVAPADAPRGFLQVNRN